MPVLPCIHRDVFPERVVSLILRASFLQSHLHKHTTFSNLGFFHLLLKLWIRLPSHHTAQPCCPAGPKSHPERLGLPQRGKVAMGKAGAEEAVPPAPIHTAPCIPVMAAPPKPAQEPQHQNEIRQQSGKTKTTRGTMWMLVFSLKHADVAATLLFSMPSSVKP